MKKVLIITNHSFMFWQFRRELAQTMVQRGYEVVLACPLGDRVEDLRGLGCKLIDTPLNRRGMSPMEELKLYRLYRKLIEEQKPDMVVTYSIKPNVYAGSICAKLGIPYCVNVQGLGTAFQKPAMAMAASAMYRFALKKAKVVFFENEENAAYFRNHKIMDPRKQVVLRGAGVNMEHYALQPYPENDCVHFLYLGRMMREKGIEELLAAVRRLHQEGHRFFLDLVGFYEDAYGEQVEQLEKLGISKFHGFQIDARPFYAAADCVVLPSYHEGMSNVLLEAASIGRPLITSDIPGCREAVEPGVTGYTCPAMDGDALYEAMKTFLSLSRQQRETMGLKGNARMGAMFNKTDVVEKTYQAIFEENAYETVH